MEYLPRAPLRKVGWGISEYFSGNWLLFLTGSRYWQAVALRRKSNSSS